MMEVSGSEYKIGAIFAGTFALVYLLVSRASGQRGTRTKKWPPSIGCLPVVGSLPFLPPTEALHSFFAEKSQQLGDVVSFRAGSIYTVVLNSHAAMREAFVKRYADMADRPIRYVKKYMNPEQKGYLDHQYNPDFKRYHQLALSILKEFGFGQNIMETRIHDQFLHMATRFKAISENQIEPNELVFSAVLNVMSTIVFGHTIEQDDALKSACLHFFEIFKSSRAWVACDVFPVVRYFPKYRRIVQNSVNNQGKLFKAIDRIIDENIASTGKENFIVSFIQREGENFDREELKQSIRDLLAAGSETTSATVLWTMAVLADHPDVARRLQEEIDSVVPRDRLPSLDDKQKLPYVEAAILEIMRYKTIVPLALPHTAMCDTEVGGYFIPKGATVLANLHAAHMNPHVWDKPHEFRPERFLDAAGCVINRDLMITFSLGKRSCLGELLARQEVYLFITGLVQQFHIRPPQGVERVEPKEEVGTTVQPAPFKIHLLPRD